MPLAKYGLQRVAVIDFDVHHGNGTEDIFQDNGKVLMVSIFQHPFIPIAAMSPRGKNMLNAAQGRHVATVSARQ